jgi:hypothetical protein
MRASAILLDHLGLGRCYDGLPVRTKTAKVAKLSLTMLPYMCIVSRLLADKWAGLSERYFKLRQGALT